jgi:hypothetical protein
MVAIPPSCLILLRWRSALEGKRAFRFHPISTPTYQPKRCVPPLHTTLLTPIPNPQRQPWLKNGRAGGCVAPLNWGAPTTRQTTGASHASSIPPRSKTHRGFRSQLPPFDRRRGLAGELLLLPFYVPSPHFLCLFCFFPIWPVPTSAYRRELRPEEESAAQGFAPLKSCFFFV